MSYLTKKNYIYYMNINHFDSCELESEWPKTKIV